MEGARSAMINGGSLSQRFNSGRLIPKRGQVKFEEDFATRRRATQFRGFYTRRRATEMEGSASNSTAGGATSRRFSGPLIPKRDQVKMGIVVGLANFGFNLQSSSSISAHGSSLSNS
ncbi:hypothetical protein ACFX2C_005100 [Malus domestica]